MPQEQVLVPLQVTPLRHWLVLAIASGTEPRDVADHGTQRARTGAGPPSGRRLLVVDDEPEMLELTRMVLEQSFPGVAVETAETAMDALRLMETRAYDAVVSDYRMPQMNGLEFLIQAADRIPEDRRILMTAYADRNLQQRAREAGLEFIEKAGDPQNIVDAVRRALRP